MIISAIVLIMVVLYYIMLLRIKSNARKYDDQQINLSTPSYDPIIKVGKYKVRLEKVGPDPKATVSIINRYREDQLNVVVAGSIVAENLNVYTAEDLVYELKYIGAEGEVIN